MYPFKREPGYNRGKNGYLLHKYSLQLRKTHTRGVPKLTIEPRETIDISNFLDMFAIAIKATEELAVEIFGERVIENSFTITQEIEVDEGCIESSEWVIKFNVVESEEDKTARELSNKRVADLRKEKQKVRKDTKRTKDIQKLLADPEAKEMLKELLKGG